MSSLELLLKCELCSMIVSGVIGIISSSFVFYPHLNAFILKHKIERTAVREHKNVLLL